MTQPIIVCENLVKIYKVADLEVVALQGLDLEVQQGEMMAIVGASGSGKTTLMNILGGLDVPSAGKAIVDGNDLTRLSEAQRIAYRRYVVGHIWQQSGRNLLPELSAQANIELPQLLGGVGSVRRSHCSNWWVSAGARRTCPTSSPAASSSASPSPSLSPMTLCCCWPTSRPANWTPSPLTR